MENLPTTQDREKEKATFPASLSPMSISVLTAHQTGFKIKTMVHNMQPIDEALRVCFSLIGLSEIPNNLDLKVLKDFIFLKLGNYTPEDLKQAFIMIASGEIETKISSYGKFSPIYLGAVMLSYQTYLNAATMEKKRADDKAALNREKSPEEIEADKQRNEKEFGEMIHRHYDEFVDSGNYTVMIRYADLAYDYLVSKGLLFLTEEEQKDIREKAIQLYNFDEQEKNKLHKNGNSADSKKISEMFRNNTLKKYRRFIAVERCFEKLKEQNHKF